MLELGIKVHFSPKIFRSRQSNFNLSSSLLSHNIWWQRGVYFYVVIMLSGHNDDMKTDLPSLDFYLEKYSMQEYRYPICLLMPLSIQDQCPSSRFNQLTAFHTTQTTENMFVLETQMHFWLHVCCFWNNYQVVLINKYFNMKQERTTTFVNGQERANPGIDERFNKRVILIFQFLLVFKRWQHVKRNTILVRMCI